MSYKIKWSKIALLELEKLPSEISQRIITKLDSVKENPEHFIKGLSNLDFNKIRVGDYRILVDLLRNEKILTIRDLGHRKNIYKKYKSD